ncbi:hypothetical protein GQF61_11805 [Sphingobacterium sp. DK4209]|uniref:Nucleotide-diphospho-sugar transferase domain-containing protein n=1 Tax=Sphingobacterium zhuxiongii TaxID=2662364 RepID=A0A5Q0QJ94_9SPHI|nr:MULTISPECIES: hypothetical protein [unclassified Sphingobacterium]MVZ66546.1 hypothetical protein [Sphingobacterium sp. DK4209]QGA27800.1 hypothetical protein GFH32_16385 [Sphingobacterium sp. dk4302]
MKKVFISFADDAMAYSLKRVGKLARDTGLFTDVILYTPNTLPEVIKDSPLLSYRRGAGYWAWKPAIIWETLQKFEEGTVVVYSDAGNTICKSDQWEEYFKLLDKFDTVCFAYKDVMLEWEKFGQSSTKIGYWTKQSTQNFFKEILKDQDYGFKYNKIMGGVFLVRGKSNEFIRRWLSITLEHPELIIDPTEEEKKAESATLAYHKHDQSIITPLAHLYKDSVYIMHDKAEDDGNSAFFASRVRTKTKNDYYKLVMRNSLRKLLGVDFYNTLKSSILKKKR